jgi:hypothetical protein
MSPLVALGGIADIAIRRPNVHFLTSAALKIATAKRSSMSISRKRAVAKVLTKDEARRIAANVAMPALLKSNT